MRGFILILLLFPVFCFAQKETGKTTSAVKPSTTDCPSWKKKDKKSKADYFQSLRTNRVKTNPQATANPVNYRDTKAEANSEPQKTENSNQKRKLKHSSEETTSEKAEIVKPKKTEKSNPVLSKKNDPNNPTEDDKNKIIESEKSSAKISEKPIVYKVRTEENKTAPIAVDSSKTNDLKKDQKDNKTEDGKLKRKLERMSRKTTKVRRHSNSKCPSF